MISVFTVFERILIVLHLDLRKPCKKVRHQWLGWNRQNVLKELGHILEKPHVHLRWPSYIG